MGAVQMNSKLGCAGWGMDFRLRDTMVVGVDTSAEKMKTSKVTVAGVVCTLDEKCTKYYSRALNLKPKTDHVADVGAVVGKAARRWEQANGSMPRNILIVRDGLGEGDVKTIRDNELVAVKYELEQVGCDARICHMMVIKRHRIRLMAQQGSDMLGNPQAGTVVDSIVTSPEGIEFVLVPQAVNRGTVSPIKFQCIYNDTTWQAGELQEACFQLCHMYYNWFGTVRTPMVCQYAHKIAALVGTHLGGQEDEELRLANRLYYL
eukprot:NODE_407_length_972_cov_891.598050_g314_i0.p1 GENE.NODE_407_length_972_cov_891.598050_g314_i0~~NODE_407_length_972_cov_891.598050_g314_i0.p1  ORF type:complete len:262 (+),score=46.97 NODE_407_length_972_cov_891.598050_g314_i0:30-815(+)